MPELEALPNENFRAGLIGIAADRCLSLDLMPTWFGHPAGVHNGATHHELDLFKGRQILFVKFDGSPNDSPLPVSRRTLDFDGVLVMHANRHILDPLRPHSSVPAVNGPPRDEFEPLLASRWVWVVIWDG